MNTDYLQFIHEKLTSLDVPEDRLPSSEHILSHLEEWLLESQSFHEWIQQYSLLEGNPDQDNAQGQEVPSRIHLIQESMKNID